MSKSGGAPTPARTRLAPWLWGVAFILSILLFWVLPYQLGPRKIDVEFTPATPLNP